MITNSQMNKDYTLVCFRIIACFFILICHIGNSFGNGIIAQAFSVGVQFFLFISGCLYANKKIDNIGDFLLKRYTKLTIPVLIYVTFCVLASLLFGMTFSWLSIPLYIFNLQGYSHFFEFIPQIALVPGTEHLWFVSVIFICYLLICLLQKIDLKLSKKQVVILTILLTLLSFILAYIGIRADYILVFMFGYLIKKYNIPTNLKGILISFLIMVVCVGFRILLKKYCDNNYDIALYTQTVIPLSYISITLFAYFILDAFIKMTSNTFVYYIISRPIISFIDSLTYFLYISHYIFLVDKTNILGLDINVFLKTLLFLICSTILSLILYFANRIISYFIKQAISRKEGYGEEKRN